MKIKKIIGWIILTIIELLIFCAITFCFYMGGGGEISIITAAIKAIILIIFSFIISIIINIAVYLIA